MTDNDDLEEIQKQLIESDLAGLENMPLDNAIKAKKIIISYLKMKIEDEDWHGVADAAMDLRELEVYIRLSKR